MARVAVRTGILPSLAGAGRGEEGLICTVTRVGNFRQKNNSAEDGIDGTNGYFRRNSGCSAEQKLSEFRSEPFRGREDNSEFRSVEQNSRNSLQNASAVQKRTRNSVPWHKKNKNTLGIPFRTLPRKRKKLGIPFRNIPRKRKLLRTKRGSPNFKNSVRKDVLKSVNVYI
jgi:hypothetical protein